MEGVEDVEAELGNMDTWSLMDRKTGWCEVS